jgi:hypothetical protein
MDDQRELALRGNAGERAAASVMERPCGAFGSRVSALERLGQVAEARARDRA